MDRGKFITFEGGEGSGKSTQVKLLAKFLRQQKIDVIETREVGGSPAGEEIRELWLSKGENHWDALSEVFLIFAARREHLVRTIWPAINSGKWVISDRFVDSTSAYQGVGMDVGLDIISNLYQQIAGDFEPDLTLLLDVPVEVGLARMAARHGQDDRYQQKDIAFHKVLRKTYLSLAQKHSYRFEVIDANQDQHTVAESIETAIGIHFKIHANTRTSA